MLKDCAIHEPLVDVYPMMKIKNVEEVALNVNILWGNEDVLEWSDLFVCMFAFWVFRNNVHRSQFVDANQPSVPSMQQIIYLVLLTIKTTQRGNFLNSCQNSFTFNSPHPSRTHNVHVGLVGWCGHGNSIVFLIAWHGESIGSLSFHLLLIVVVSCQIIHLWVQKIKKVVAVNKGMLGLTTNAKCWRIVHSC